MSQEQYLTLNKASGPNSDAPATPFVKIVALIATLGGFTLWLRHRGDFRRPAVYG